MREEIKFRTSAELAEYILMKGDLYTKSGGKLFVDRERFSDSSPFRYSREGSTTSDPFKVVWDVTRITFFREVSWEENLKDGVSVLCYVSDEDCKPTAVTGHLFIVCSYRSANRFPYRTNKGSSWRYAVPATDFKLWSPDQ